MTAVEPRRRKGPDPWIEAAYVLLAEQRHSAVTIERLTAATAKTRGSFYHHFGSMETFVARLVADWQERNTERIVRLAQATREPGKRRRVLSRRQVSSMRASKQHSGSGLALTHKSKPPATLSMNAGCRCWRKT